MNLLWDGEPVVAPSDFDPTSPRPAETVSLPIATTTMRPSLKPAATSRPARLSLVELGLAAGPDAAAWEAELLRADACTRRADRRQADHTSGRELQTSAASAAAAASTAASQSSAAASNRSDPTPTPQTLATVASAIQAVSQSRSRLAEELADMERQQTELQAKLVQLLNQRG